MPASRFPKGYQEFIQRHGSRANQKYVIKTGNSGKKIRVYQNGETALATQPKRLPFSTIPERQSLAACPTSRGRYESVGSPECQPRNP